MSPDGFPANSYITSGEAVVDEFTVYIMAPADGVKEGRH